MDMQFGTMTVAQSHKLESLQKRALRMIHQIVYDMPYDSACAYVGVQPLTVISRCLSWLSEVHVTVTELFLFCDVRSLFLLFVFIVLFICLSPLFSCVFLAFWLPSF